MSLLDELRARREHNAETARQAVEERREREAKEKREQVRLKALAAALGKENGGAEIDQAVKDLAELFDFKEGAVRDLDRVRGDEEKTMEFEEELNVLEATIQSLLDKQGGEFLVRLVELDRATSTNAACLHFGRNGVELGLLESVSEQVKKDHLDRLRGAKKARKFLPPEQARYIWQIPDARNHVLENFWTKWVDPADTGAAVTIARIKAYADRFNKLMVRTRKVKVKHEAQVKDLDRDTNLLVEEMFKAGAYGMVKLDSLTRNNPWEPPPYPDGGKRPPVYGPLWIEEVEQCSDTPLLWRGTIALPEVSSLWRTLKSFGFFDEDGDPRRFIYGVDFDRIKILNGPPLRNPGAVRGFFCKAAGLELVERNPEPTRVQNSN